MRFRPIQALEAPIVELALSSYSSLSFDYVAGFMVVLRMRLCDEVNILSQKQ